MKKLLAMVCVLMSVPSASFAYVCPRTYPMAVHYTLFETANGAISQGIAQVDIGLSSLLNYYSPRVEAALATLCQAESIFIQADRRCHQGSCSADRQCKKSNVQEDAAYQGAL